MLRLAARDSANNAVAVHFLFVQRFVQHSNAYSKYASADTGLQARTQCALSGCVTLSPHAS
jgi:hypothetical protein